MKRFSFASIAVAAAVVTVAVAGALTLAPRATAAGAIVYTPIDPKIFVGHNTAAKWAQTHNEPAVSQHAVALWNGLTALTDQRLAGQRLAVFSTWYTPCEVYPNKTNCNHAIVHDPTDIEVPQQFFRTPRLSATNVFSGVKYNREMVSFIEQGYQGLSYANGKGLVKAIDNGLTNLIDTAPPSAMMTKPVYQLVSMTQPTVIHYWQGPGLNVPLGASTSPLVPDVNTWLKIVVVDPTGKETNTKPRTFCADTIDPYGAVVAHATYTAPARSYKVVPLSEFYWLPMSVAGPAHVAELRARFTAMQERRLVASYGRRALAQDPGCPDVTPVNPALLFVGMHVVSAELNDVWTWQTFWWTPNAKPLPGAQGPFAHFDYATAYWTIDKPPYGYRYAFNPYLEAGFGTNVFITPAFTAKGPGSVMNLGRTTDCISCHEAATWTVNPSPAPSPGYVAHGDQPQVAVKNSKSILARNLWSLADRASHP